MNFYVGQRVVCVPRVGEAKGGCGWEVYPVVGETYTIRDLEDLGDGPGVRLVEIVNKRGNYQQGYVEVNFCPSRFRAATSIAMFTDMLTTNELETCQG